MERLLERLKVFIVDMVTSKTFYAGLSLAALGVKDIMEGNQDAGLSKIASGFGLIFLKHATVKTERAARVES